MFGSDMESLRLSQFHELLLVLNQPVLAFFQMYQPVL